jgi:predicted AAA+ superfamily ATPase
MPTAKEWMGVLEASNIVWLLRPYSRNITARIVKTPKLYFLDTGLCSHLLGWDSPTTLMNGAMAGAMLETFVVGEILKSFWNVGRTPRLYFYRDKVGAEIDLLIEHDGILDPIEVKRSTNPMPSDIKAFRKIESLGFKLGHGAVICPTEKALPLVDGVVVFPVGAV